MKKNKKLLSLLLAAIMLLGITVSFSIQSFAEDEAPRSIIDEKSDSEYVIGSEKGLSVYCRYYIAGFNIADLSAGRITKPSESDYIMNEDSTVLTLKSSYLDTLKVGEYIVSVFYDTQDNGYINQHEFSVVEPETEETTQKRTESLTKPNTENTTETTVEHTTVPSVKSPPTGDDYVTVFIFIIVSVLGLGSAVCLTLSRKKCKE